MTKIWTDGSETETCFIIEGQGAVRQPASTLGQRVTGNVGEYYALIHALQEARAQGLKRLTIYADSQLMVRQLMPKPDQAKRYIYETKNPRLWDLRRVVFTLIKNFEFVEFKWVPRGQNPAGLELERKKGKL